MTSFKRLRAIAFIGWLVVAATSACNSKPTSTASSDASPSSTSAKLTDLSTSLDEIRSAFNAHKGEARFLTLLSPG